MNAYPSLKPIITVLGLPVSRSLAANVLQFLALEDLQAIAEAADSSNCSNYFLLLVRNANFLSQFINRTDKSLYFTFYAEPEHKAIEAAQVSAVAQEGTGVFLTQHSAFQAVMQMLREQVPAAEEDLQMLTSLLADPELPLPRLKRETQGMYCTSPFQLFLVDCTFRQDDQEFFCFETLREQLSDEREEIFVKQFMGLLKEKHGVGATELRKVMKVRYTPYEVTSTNFNEFLLQDNQLHNFIVGLFALTDVMVEATHAYISRIQDPLHRLVQLLLRYSIFRNYVLSVQEYLSFAFKMYENVYHDSIEQDPRKPQYRFWRPALTKWFLRMDYLHSQGMRVYFHCLTRLRKNHLCNALAELAVQDQCRYGKILNEVELNDFEYVIGAQVYGGELSTGSEMGLYFDCHPQNYEMVVMEFNEYLVDISVNEQTVHWCGHSRHQLEKPYLLYEQQLLELNRDYTRSLYLQKPSISIADKKKLIQLDVEYLSVLQIKNRTLKALLNQTNEELQLVGELCVTFDFEEADRKLEFFNAKALILAAVDQHERPFYSIPPLCSPDKLIDMLDTNDSSNNNSDQENFQYLTESEGQHSSQPHISHNNRNKEHFEDEEAEEALAHPVGKKPHSLALKKVFAQDLESESSPLPLLKSHHVLKEEF